MQHSVLHEIPGPNGFKGGQRDGRTSRPEAGAHKAPTRRRAEDRRPGCPASSRLPQQKQPASRRAVVPRQLPALHEPRCTGQSLSAPQGCCVTPPLRNPMQIYLSIGLLSHNGFTRFSHNGKKYGFIDFGFPPYSRRVCHVTRLKQHLYFCTFEGDEDTGSTQPSPALCCVLADSGRPDYAQTFMPQIKNRKFMQPTCWEFITHSPAPEPAFLRCEARQEEERHAPRK